MQNKLSPALEEIFEPIKTYLAGVDEAIPKILKTGITLMNASSLHLFKKGGKKIRASIVILCSGLKNEIPEDIIDIAAAVEIFHGATLIHDDIIDQTFLRRGAITVSKEWGNKIAVLAGDFMHVRSLQTILNNSKSLLVNELLAAALDMFKGEIYQMEFSNIDSISKDHYFNIIELKTAIFMGTCAKLGAMKAEMSEEEAVSLYNFGLNLGRAFQIIDDTFDYVDKNITGKDAGNDFNNGKITLPFIHLLETATGSEKEKLVECVKNPCGETWEFVRQMIDKYNVITFCADTAKEYLQKAFPCLVMFPSSLYKDKLLDLAGYLVDREY